MLAEPFVRLLSLAPNPLRFARRPAR
jgi:hypothetical protein